VANTLPQQTTRIKRIYRTKTQIAFYSWLWYLGISAELRTTIPVCVHGRHRLRVTDIMSAPTASCLPSRTKANKAVKYVIGTVLDFDPVDDCPLWLALIHDATDKSRVNIYNQWLWLTPDDIASRPTILP
jgi:hypothetical protein